MRIAIIDDDAQTIQTICEKLTHIEANEEIATQMYTNPSQFLEYFDGHTFEFDIIFLDVYMPELSGIEVAEVIRQHNNNVLLLFLTSAEDKNIFAQICQLRAFRLLYKPINDEKFIESVNSAIRNRLESRARYFMINKGDKKIKIAIEDIYYFDCNRRIISVTYGGGEESFYGRLQDICDLVLANDFYLINKGILVNLKYVNCLHNKREMVEMSNGVEKKISRERIKDFTSVLFSYTRGQREWLK